MIKRVLDKIQAIGSILPPVRIRRSQRLSFRFAKRPLNMAGLVFLITVVAAAVFADLLASDKPIACRLDGRLYVLPAIAKTPELLEHDNWTIQKAIDDRGGWALFPPVPFGPNQIKVLGQVSWLKSPDRVHLLGTDDSGRDVLARLIHGARSAVLVGLGSMALSALIGLLLGAVAGYFGGAADRIALRLIETMSSFPNLFLVLALQGLIGSTSLYHLILFIGLTRWNDIASLTRAEVLRTANEDYVTAARALGLGHLAILRRHIVPATMGPVLIAATFGVANAILIESTLSFLGFGVPPDVSSWGELLTDAFNNEGCYWLSIFPGLALFMTLMSTNLVGEGLRDALDPRG